MLAVAVIGILGVLMPACWGFDVKADFADMIIFDIGMLVPFVSIRPFAQD